MTLDEWEERVPPEIKNDSLWKMEVYRSALFAGDLAWSDVTKLARDRRTVGVADQLYRAIGSVSETIAEGYSRSSGRDQARFYEYALGSARESRGWYSKGRHVLGPEVAMHRIRLLSSIIRLLLVIIPGKRSSKAMEERAPYGVDMKDLLRRVPASSLTEDQPVPYP